MSSEFIANNTLRKSSYIQPGSWSSSGRSGHIVFISKVFIFWCILLIKMNQLLIQKSIWESTICTKLKKPEANLLTQPHLLFGQGRSTVWLTQTLCHQQSGTELHLEVLLGWSIYYFITINFLSCIWSEVIKRTPERGFVKAALRRY